MFISRYANDNALPLPGRLPNCSKKTALLLPSDKKIADIHDLYEKSAFDMGCRHVSLRTYRRIWTELCPHISIAKPTSDLCEKCQKFAHSITKSGQFCEEEKAQQLADYQGHIEYAKLQRDHYRAQTLKSKEFQLQLTSKFQDNEPCSVDGTYHYSWDYAQQVHYPPHSQQVGPIFFKTARKCNVFGVCAEGSGKQTFYLVDEGESVGKGADSVASMVHHYFKHFGIGEKHAEVHFDNCCGQNKNNVILWYAMWRVLTGLHETIQYSMMVAGHTKFAPDWHFRVWKVKWRDSNAETMEDIANSVRLSSRSGHNIPQLIKDQERPVSFYKWRLCLSRYFKKLKHITKFHHFTVSAKYHGYVLCKEYATSEEVKISLLKQKPDEGLLPELADIPGLDPSRQWYLYEQIREYFISNQARDVVCPQPIIPKVECNLDSHEKWTSANSRERQTALLINY